MSSLTQAVYEDFRKARSADGFCPVVLNAKQERQAGGGNTIWYTSQNSGKDLWRLKKDKPELFAFQEQKDAKAAAGPEALPPGFEATQQPGWHYSREKNLFFLQDSKKFVWFDEDAQLHRELHKGESASVSFLGGAASAGERPRGDALGNGKVAPPPRHVVIADLHRAAQALKVDLGHLDRPAAMLAAFGGAAAEKAETAARGYHEKLVKRLGAYRSAWSDNALCQAVRGALDDVGAAGQQVGGVASAVALVSGRRVATAATPGASCCVVGRADETASASVAAASSSAARPGARAPLPVPPAQIAGAAAEAAAPLPPGTLCTELAEEGATEALSVALTVGEMALTEADIQAAMGPHLPKRRPRAASVALLRAARRSGMDGSVAACCARLAVGGEAEVPPAKRPKTTAAAGVGGSGVGVGGASSGTVAGDQVRVRQILLRYATGAKAVDPVRKKQVSRPLEEAEAQMLEVLTAFEADGPSSFARVCREISECQCALKGGELAGDLGWLDRVKGASLQQDRAKSAVRPQVPPGVLKAAFELAVGEFHDLVTSDMGVHLLQRTA